MAVKFLDINYLRAQNTTTGQVIVTGSSSNLNSTSSILVVNGKVGIGSATPTQQLSIGGNLAIFGQSSVLQFPDGTTQNTSASASIYPGGISGSVQYNNDGNFGGNGNFYWDSVNSRLGIGTNTPYSTLQIIDVGYESTNTSVSDQTPVVLDSFPVPNYRSCHYIVQVTDTNNSWYQTSQIMLIQDGINSYQNEYNLVITQTRMGEFDSQVNGGNVELIFTAFYSSSKNIKVIRTSIEP